MTATVHALLAGEPPHAAVFLAAAMGFAFILVVCVGVYVVRRALINDANAAEDRRRLDLD